MTEPIARGTGRKSAQIRSLQGSVRALEQRPGPGRATSHTPAGTFVTPTKRPTQRGGGGVTLVRVEGYWA